MGGTDIFGTSSEPGDDFALHAQWERGFGPRVRPDDGGPGPVWSHFDRRMRLREKGGCEVVEETED